MVAPTVNLSRTATVTVANPTPPTNVAVLMQNTPPTPTGTTPAGAAAPDEANKGVFINALNAPTPILPAGRPEAFGTEVHVNGPVAPAPLNYYTSTHSDLGSYTERPNATHPSTLTPPGVTTLASISPTSTVSGAGTQLLTATGTNFTKQSVIVVNAVPQTTTFVSNTSITATVTKKATAGTWPVIVNTGGAQTAPQTWTFT